MYTFASYVLKVIICSGILYGYYLIALRNKIFHSWNRFYLLGVVILSLTFPLITINIQKIPETTLPQLSRILQVVNTQENETYKTSDIAHDHFDFDSFFSLCYILISTIFLINLSVTFIKLFKLKSNALKIFHHGIEFIFTNVKGTPFSFFNTVFWNDKIEINSPAGEQILKHELAHITENHTYDKIFVNLILVVFWSNPFFWLIRKELGIIHEFIADQKAVNSADSASLAKMILQAAYPNQSFHITNSFFQSPLKRRLFMITQNKNPRISYLGRISALIIAVIVFISFTLKMSTIPSSNHLVNKPITVIIDPAHGGIDAGASKNGLSEKYITLAIAKKIKELNQNKNIKVILTRERDVDVSLDNRIKYASSLKADLYISIHVDYSTGYESGISILVPKNENRFFKQSELLGSTIHESLISNHNFPVSDLQQMTKSVRVLKENTSPAILIETGNLANQKDIEFLNTDKYQTFIANNILAGIEKYAVNNQTQSVNIESIKDTSKNINGVFLDARNNVAIESELIIHTTEPNKTYSNIKKGVVIIDGKKQPFVMVKDKFITCKKLIIHSGDELNISNNFGPNAIYGVFEFVNILSSKDYTYFTKGKISNSKEQPLFTKVEIPAKFPGGHTAWLKYLHHSMEKRLNDLMSSSENQGTCIIEFEVNKNGSLSNIRPTTMLRTKLAEVGVNILALSKKWDPAIQNGHLVNSLCTIPISFKMNDKLGITSEPQ